METTLFASVLSTEPDSQKAVRGATDELLSAFGGVAPDLLAVFVSHHHGEAIEALGQDLSASTHARTLIGCTGESIVGSAQEIERGPALSVWAAHMPNTKLRPFAVTTAKESETSLSFSCLPEVRDPARASILMFADPFAFPMPEYLELLNQKLAGVPVVGGMASGGSGPGQNFLLTADGIAEAGAIGIVIEGDVEVRSVVSQGCRPVGKPLVITACKENLIHKLSGKSALQALMEMFPTLSPADRTLLQSRPFIGLAVDSSKSTFERGDFLVRQIIGADHKAGHLAVNDGSLRAGQTVQFLVRDALSAGEDLVHLMRERAGGPVGAPSSTGALIFSCNGRGTRMFATPNHDISCVQTAFQVKVPAAGFFANGEIGPVGGRNYLHGFTASVAVFRPRAPG